MSYKAPATGDSLNDLFTQWTDFLCVSPNLLNADTKQNFEIWLEKLELIDRRLLFLFLKNNKKDIRPEYLQLAQRRYIKEI